MARRAHPTFGTTVCTVATLAALVASAVTSTFVAASPAAATVSFTVDRLAGEDRYATAARIALATFGTSDDAIVASGEDFPDALAGNYLAGRRQAPVLLARRSGVPAVTLQTLQQLGVQRVTLLGGEGALGAAVATALSQAGFTVDRLAGHDRFETAAAVARAAGPPPSRTAFVASGRTFADALAAGPLAYGSPIPQLLTEPGTVPASVTSALVDLGITHVVVLGGAGAVGADVLAQLRQRGFEVGRVSGADRYATSTAIADWAVNVLGHRRDHVDLATGTNFPDALAGGVHSGAHRGVVLLVEPDPTGGAAARWLAAHHATVAGGHLFGGVQALADAALTVLVNAARGVLAPVEPLLCETTMATLVNTERLVRGLAGFTISPAAAAIAEGWSAHLASVGGLSHNPSLGAQLDAAGIPWRGWAENVGYSSSAVDVHHLLMHSPPHVANLLDPRLTHLGIGCVVDGQGLVWITQVFYRL